MHAYSISMAPTSKNSRPRHMYYCCSIVQIVATLFVFLLEVNCQEAQPSFCFNMNNFEPNQEDIILQGQATVTPTGKLELTNPVARSLGRVLFSSPIKIWDITSNTATSFTTTFTFVVQQLQSQTADGIAFFIAPPNYISHFDLTGSLGGYLGLFNDPYNNTNRQIVAVEFDTCFNAGWDPPGPYHIGIDVNSIQSVRTTPWEFQNGETATAVINYSADNNLLSVSLSYAQSQVTNDLGYSIDLRNVLPEWVSIGISATTGLEPDSVESHHVLSWSFHAFRSTNHMQDPA